MRTEPSGLKAQWEQLVGMLLFIVLLPWLLIWVAGLILSATVLYLLIWMLWVPRGKRVLFVYSDSPTWHDYIEQHTLPRLRDQAEVLNWSERKTWRRSLATLAFWRFSGTREFNPVAIVFQPFRFARTFRFYKPFQDFKHGDPSAVVNLENELLALLDSASARGA